MCWFLKHFLNTVKPVLLTTSGQWPPAFNGQPKTGQTKLNIKFHLKPSTEQLPMYNIHLFVVPKVEVIVYRFDCISNG